MIIEKLSTTHPQQSHLSQHTGVVRINVTLYGILSCYEPALITNEHFPSASEARFTVCLCLRVSPLCMCTK